MKKNEQYRVKKQTVRNAKRSSKAKKRNYPRIVINGKYIKKYCPVETTRDFEIGPSLVTEVKAMRNTSKSCLIFIYISVINNTK